MRPVLFLFLLVSVLIVGTADISIKLFNLYGLKKDVLNLKNSIDQNEKINFIQKKPQKINHLISREKIIDMFLMNAESGGLSLQSFSSANDDGSDLNQMLSVNAVFKGRFKSILAFFNKMTEQCLPFEVQFVGISMDGVQLKLKINFSISMNCLQEANQTNLMIDEKIIHNPFDSSYEKYSGNESEFYSIKRLRFVGFLKYQNHFSAIVRLPDNETKEVVLGEKVGAERAKVVRIDETGFWVQMNGITISIKT